MLDQVAGPRGHGPRETSRLGEGEGNGELTTIEPLFENFKGDLGRGMDGGSAFAVHGAGGDAALDIEDGGGTLMGASNSPPDPSGFGAALDTNGELGADCCNAGHSVLGGDAGLEGLAEDLAGSQELAVGALLGVGGR